MRSVRPKRNPCFSGCCRPRPEKTAIGSPFRTLQLHIRDLFDIGVRSAEFARKLIDNPGAVPYTEYLDVVSDSYENAINADIFR